MNWMDKLERKIGRYAIPRIYRYFVAAIIIGYLMLLAGRISPIFSLLLSWFQFSPYDILHGQIWRLVTWIFIPSNGLDVFAIIFLLCVLMWGSSIEMMLGTFRTNVFLIGGVLLSDIGGLLIYAISYAVLGKGIPVQLTTYYLMITMLMALAICMPEGEVRLWFVLPIKMKWMLVIELVYLFYEVYLIFANVKAQLGNATALMVTITYASQIVLALLNMALFFFFAKRHVSHKQKKRQKEFKQQFGNPRPGSGITKHKCAICGRTELDDPSLTFRYCSKCVGNKEYCQEHLFTHTHITSM